MDETISIEMTPAQHQDFLLLQVVRASEEATRRRRALEAAEQAWTEALRMARDAGCTDEQIEAVAHYMAPEMGSLAARGPASSGPAAAGPAAEPEAGAGLTSAYSSFPQSEEPLLERLAVTAYDDYFQPHEVALGAGDILAVSNLGSKSHTFTIEETDVDLIIEPRAETTADLSSVRPGTYSFFCRKHRARGMTGTITILGGSAR